MRTLLVSDLHLGAGIGNDLVRRPALRKLLVAALDDVDRLVLLGDTVELRTGNLAAALEEAGPLLEEAGRRVKEIVLVPGNHDAALIGPWLQRHERPALELETRIAAADASPSAARLAEFAGPARLDVAHPGLWVRPDVYATHGHYLDRHITVPTFERLAAGLMGRLVGKIPERATPQDYENALWPVYAWMYALASTGSDALVRGAGSSARTWTEMTGRRRRWRGRILYAGLPGAVAALNRLGVGPLKPHLSGDELRRAALRAMEEVVRHLGVDAAHVVFGHTHRSGPWPGDDPAEWTTAGGVRFTNLGSWVFQRHFVTSVPNESPYWPGVVATVEDDGPPRLARLLGYRSAADLTSPLTAAPA